MLASHQAMPWCSISNLDIISAVQYSLPCQWNSGMGVDQTGVLSCGLLIRREETMLALCAVVNSDCHLDRV